MAIFVLPPLFAPFFSGGENVLEFSGFSWWNAACLLVAALLNFFLGEFQGEIFRGTFFGERGILWNGNFGNKNFGSEGSGAGKIRRVIVFAEFLKTFGLLCATQAFFEFLGFVMKVRPATTISFPCNINIAQILSWGVALFSAAFYEETLYRAYLPFSLKRIFCKKWRSQNGFSNAENEVSAETDCAQSGKRARFFDAAFEIVAIAIFGFSHLQNGALAVANALFAGFFLRRCAVRTGGIKAGFFAHFLYNALTLALMSAVGFARN